MWRRGQAMAMIGVVALAAACGVGHGSGSPSADTQPLTGAAADHARMASMRFRLDDLGPSWRHVQPRVKQPTACEPDPDGVTITAGSWKNRGVAYASGSNATLESDAIVFATPQMAETALRAYMQPANARCLERQVRRSFHPRRGVSLLGITTRDLKRHRVADAFDGFRLTIAMAKKHAPEVYKVYVDVLVVRQDRALAAFTYANAFTPAPLDAEYTLAQAVADRGALAA